MELGIIIAAALWVRFVCKCKKAADNNTLDLRGKLKEKNNEK